MVNWAVNGRVLRPVELWMLIVAPIWDALFGGEGSIFTGCGRRGTTLRLMGKIPRINRSINDMPSSKSTARLAAIPNQTLVCRSSIRR